MSDHKSLGTWSLGLKDYTSKCIYLANTDLQSWANSYSKIWRFKTIFLRKMNLEEKTYFYHQLLTHTGRYLWVCLHDEDVRGQSFIKPLEFLLPHVLSQGTPLDLWNWKYSFRAVTSDISTWRIRVIPHKGNRCQERGLPGTISHGTIQYS